MRFKPHRDIPEQLKLRCNFAFPIRFSTALTSLPYVQRLPSSAPTDQRERSPAHHEDPTPSAPVPSAAHPRTATTPSPPRPSRPQHPRAPRRPHPLRARPVRSTPARPDDPFPRAPVRDAQATVRSRPTFLPSHTPRMQLPRLIRYVSLLHIPPRTPNRATTTATHNSCTY